MLDLVRREATCCPFLSYQVDEVDQDITWTTSGGLGTSEMAIVDDFLAAEPGTGGSSSTIANSSPTAAAYPSRCRQTRSPEPTHSQAPCP